MDVRVKVFWDLYEIALRDVSCVYIISNYIFWEEDIAVSIKVCFVKSDMSQYMNPTHAPKEVKTREVRTPATT